MFKILSLDGGGIRGAFAAAFLAKMQASLDAPLVEYFDLIAGTSTGGLIAAALALGLSPAQIVAFYRELGPEIFKRPPPRMSGVARRALDMCIRRIAPGLDAEWLFHSKYDARSLREAVQAQVGGRLLGEAACRLVIPAVDLTAAKVVVFKTPHRPGFIRDRHIPARDVILATTAAPTYFPHAMINPGSAYSDGGLWANNPALLGYVEAVKISQECNRAGIDPAFSPDDIYLLSVGTGNRSYFANPSADDTGLRWWAPRFLSVSSEAQSEGIHWQTKYLLDERYTRVNFDIPNGNWSLDSVEMLDQLMHLGQQRAVENFGALRAQFFAQRSTRYVPFPE